MRSALCLLLIGVASAQPPKATKSPTVEDFHGTRIEESYRWLEDPDSADAPMGGRGKPLYAGVSRPAPRAAIKERLTQLFLYDRYPNFTADRGPAPATSHAVPSPSISSRRDYRINPFSTFASRAATGRCWIPTRCPRTAPLLSAPSLFRGTASGWPTPWLRQGPIGSSGVFATWQPADMPDLLDWSKFSSATWDARGEGFYYGRYPAPAPGNALQALNENYQLCYHRLETPQSADRVVYQRPDQPRWTFGSDVSEDGRYLLISLHNGRA